MAIAAEVVEKVMIRVGFFSRIFRFLLIGPE
jgi:hypothetical protein